MHVLLRKNLEFLRKTCFMQKQQHQQQQKKNLFLLLFKFWSLAINKKKEKTVNFSFRLNCEPGSLPHRPHIFYGMNHWQKSFHFFFILERVLYYGSFTLTDGSILSTLLHNAALVISWATERGRHTAVLMNNRLVWGKTTQLLMTSLLLTNVPDPQSH